MLVTFARRAAEWMWNRHKPRITLRLKNGAKRLNVMTDVMVVVIPTLTLTTVRNRDATTV